MDKDIKLPPIPVYLKKDNSELFNYLTELTRVFQNKQLKDSDEQVKISEDISEIVEFNKNSNGSYIKFSDGTLIQYLSCSPPLGVVGNSNIGTYGWSFYGSNISGTFPAEFYDSNYRITATGGLYAGFNVVWKSGTTGYTLYWYSFFSNATSVDIIAIGKWKK